MGKAPLCPLRPLWFNRFVFYSALVTHHSHTRGEGENDARKIPNPSLSGGEWDVVAIPIWGAVCVRMPGACRRFPSRTEYRLVRHRLQRLELIFVLLQPMDRAHRGAHALPN
ncbi:MAG: hypothetical protein BroJett007_00780 [Chloroflexota bacterium]|nr:MAG: hypothetical protein BroJett007_00780 [Chloroflexota bacterium]